MLEELLARRMVRKEIFYVCDIDHSELIYIESGTLGLQPEAERYTLMPHTSFAAGCLFGGCLSPDTGSLRPPLTP